MGIHFAIDGYTLIFFLKNKEQRQTPSAALGMKIDRVRQHCTCGISFDYFVRRDGHLIDAAYRHHHNTSEEQQDDGKACRQADTDPQLIQLIQSSVSSDG
jgi:hypothetical protein